MWLLIFVKLEIESTWHPFSCSLCWSVTLNAVRWTDSYPDIPQGPARCCSGAALEIRKGASAKKPTGYPIWSQQAENFEEYKDLETVFTAVIYDVESLKGKVGTSLGLCWKKSLRLTSICFHSASVRNEIPLLQSTSLITSILPWVCIFSLFGLRRWLV